MGIEHTRVPRWPAEPPTFDGRARSVTLLGLDADAQPVVAQWEAQARTAGVPSSSLVIDDVNAAVQHLEREMASAVVGWRLLVAGPESGVLTVSAAARSLGAVGGEVLAHVTGVPLRRLHCVHCDAVTPTDVAIGGTVACVGCRRSLHLYHHVSRRLGAYLGYMVDAEEHEPGPVLADA